ncbi:MAG TPA: proteasome accessory factor PafA2 family protein [Gemmataceae bacterium]|nr:proteasome accessory factor PafA2 family protein [Gemmataceae bacterium]
MFDRLVGVETEYALRCSAHGTDGGRLTNAALFERLRANVARKVPVAPAIVPENGWFLASGGSLKMERLPFYSFMPSSGLVEGATPECRGPRQLLLYQRAQDVLLSRAARGEGTTDAVLLKCNHDGHAHHFGCHENYEATVATGIRLLVWRVTLVVALPVLFLLLLVADVAALLLCAVPSLLLRPLLSRSPRAAQVAAWALSWLVCLCRLPLQVAALMLLGPTAFVRVRRQLLPFLMSRCVIAGTGMVHRDGRFTLSPRASTLRSLCGLSAAAWRSVFYFCHVGKASGEALVGDPVALARLFRQQQRLQISVGDSNMAQFAEYLKIGTTLLVLDAIDAGELEGAPRLWRPLAALGAICADPNLQARVRLTGGRHWTAVQIQRYYLDACRRFVNRSEPENGEAQQVLRLWEQTLDDLALDPSRLVGKLDWVTKRYLLDRAGPDASRATRSKVDLRYHELSREGYYLQLEAAGLAPTLVEPEQVLDAIAQPPPGTPATQRGQLIRQHAESGLRASWSSVIMPCGSRVRLEMETRSM